MCDVVLVVCLCALPAQFLVARLVQLGEAKLKVLNKVRLVRTQCTMPAVTAIISFCRRQGPVPQEDFAGGGSRLEDASG